MDIHFGRSSNIRAPQMQDTAMRVDKVPAEDADVVGGELGALYVDLYSYLLRHGQGCMNAEQCGPLNRDKRGVDRHLGSCALPKHPRGANLSEITPGCISEPPRCSQCFHGSVAGP